MGNLILRVLIETWIIDRENKQAQPKQRGGKSIFLNKIFSQITANNWHHHWLGSS